MLFYNNTILSETPAGGASNIALAQQPVPRRELRPAIFTVNTFTNYTSSDYNGFRPNPGAESSFQWNSPPFTVAGRLFGAERGARAWRSSAQADASRAARAGRWGRGGARPRAPGSGAPGSANNASFQPSQPTARPPPGSPQRARRLRHLCECAETRRPDRATVQRVYKAGAFRLRLKTGIGGGGAWESGTPLAGITERVWGEGAGLGRA